MPSGERHLKLEMILWPVFVGGYYFIDSDWPRVAAFGLAYLLASLMLTPDLDLRHNDARRRWGILGFIWVPYTMVFKHRGVSHSLLFGIITRLAYLSLVAAGGMAGAYYAGLSLPPISWQPDWPLLAAAGAGLYTPNILHVLYDHWDTSRKLRRSRRVRARAGR